MVTIWIIKVICYLIVFLLLLLLIVQIQVYGASDAAVYTDYIDESTIETGDILGVSYRNIFGDFIAFWTSSLWSHAGIAWRDPKDNALYVFESADYNREWCGMIKVPFTTWVNLNKKCVIGVTRLRRTDGSCLDAAKLEEEFDFYQRTRFDSFNLSWYRFLSKRTYTGELQTHYTCYEMIIEILQRCDVIRKEWTCSSYFPKDVIKGAMPLESGWSFQPLAVVEASQYLKAVKCT